MNEKSLRLDDGGNGKKTVDKRIPLHEDEKRVIKVDRVEQWPPPPPAPAKEKKE
jgi:hypothetical protein